MPDLHELDQRLLAAHAEENLAALVGLYAEAANRSNDLDAACFYLTQAYVFALDLGDDRASSLRKRLINAGREE